MVETKIFEAEPFDSFAAEPLPEAQWLIEPFFEKDSQVVLWGESGSGKSFIALSWGMAIATGTPWLGRFPTKQANVLYCVGEGDRGMRRRARAGQIEYGFKSVSGFWFYPMAPRIRDPKILAAFLKMVKRCMPGLVIIDTLARSFSGDENKAEDMNDWLNAAAVIQRETGACVLVIHHTAKNIKKGGTATERGSGALRGAMDTSIQVRGGESISLHCVKQKDDKPFEDLSLFLKEIELRPATATRKALTSGVIIEHVETVPLAFKPSASPADRALELLVKPMTRDEWREVWIEEEGPVSDTTFYRRIKSLEAEGLAEQGEDLKWRRKS